MIRPKIAVLHPRLAFGGSESVALWAIEALKDRADLSLVTGGPVDLARWNAFYGTDIHENEVGIIRAPLPWTLWRTEKFAALRGALFQKYCRRMAARFDLLIHSYGLCDFPTPAIQCVADFGFVREWRDALHPELAGYRRWWYADSPLRRAYWRLCDATCRPNPEASKLNLTLSNSHWTAKLLKQKFGIVSQVVYPPVTGQISPVPWEKKENGFVCVGRVVPEKRMDAVIGILSRVRRLGHDVHLHILGKIDHSPFGRKIRRLAAQNREWVFLEGRLWGGGKARLLASHRFGINGTKHEAFGIAPAELVRAGCITFVPNSGGQTEIVDHPALTFENENDAVAKLDLVLSSTEMQRSLALHLSRQACRFAVENFVAAIRGLTQEMLAEKAVSVSQYGEA